MVSAFRTGITFDRAVSVRDAVGIGFTRQEENEMKHLAFDFEFGGNHEAAKDEWQRNANGYRVSFQYDRRRVSFDFWQGSGISHDPECSGVMECLISDARMGAETFHDFCADLGYDEDSRNAERTWKACQQIGNQLVRLFGADYAEALDTDWESVRA